MKRPSQTHDFAGSSQSAQFPRTLLHSIRDYVRRAVPEPEVLQTIGQESEQAGTKRLGDTRIDQIIKAARKAKRR